MDVPGLPAQEHSSDHRNIKGRFRKTAVFLANVLSLRFFWSWIPGCLFREKGLDEWLTGTHEIAGTGSIE